MDILLFLGWTLLIILGVAAGGTLLLIGWLYLLSYGEGS